MMSEDSYVYTDVENQSVNDDIEIEIKCKSCNKFYKINSHNIEESVISDAHDPLFDWFQCNECEHVDNLHEGLEGIVTINGQKKVGRLYSDGSYIYIVVDERSYRIA